MNSQREIKFARLSDCELQALTDFEYELGAKFGSDVQLIAIEIVPEKFARLSDRELQSITDFEYELGDKFGRETHLIAVEAVPDMYFT